MNSQVINNQDIKQEIEYFCQKFHVSEDDVREAIQKVGLSSENLEQYFHNAQLKQAAGEPSPSFGDLRSSL